MHYGAGCDRVQQHLRVGGAGGRVHPGHRALGAAGEEFEAAPAGDPDGDAMLFQLFRGRIQHPVECEHGDRVLEHHLRG